MRPFRVVARYSGTSYYLFFGYLSRIEHDPVAHESTIEAVDLSVFFNIHKVGIGAINGGLTTPLLGQTVGNLIGRILDATGFTAAGWGDLDTGRVIASYCPDGTTTVLSEWAGLLAIDQGSMWIAADAKVTYRDTTSLYSNTPAVATWTEQMVTGLRSTVTTDGMVNEQYVTRTGGVECYASDTVAWGRYEHRLGSSITSDYLVDDAQAQDLADWIVALKSKPQSPTRSLTMVNADSTRMTQMLARDLGDLVTVSESAGGTSFTGWIASVEHEITSGGQIHKTSFAVQKRPWNYFIIGTSTIGEMIGGGTVY